MAWDDLRIAQSAGGEPASAARRPRVLVCDDSDAASRLVSWLVGDGCECRLAASGAAALAAMAELDPDVVVAGAPAGGMDGRRLVGALRGRPDLAAVPVLRLAGLGEVESGAEGAEADDYLPTPVHPRLLVARVRALVRLRRAADELQERSRALEQSSRALAAARTSLARAGKLSAAGAVVAALAHEASGSLAVLKSGVASTAASLAELRRGLESLLAAAPGSRAVDLGAACGAPLAEALDILAEMAGGSARLERVARDLRILSGLERTPPEPVDVEAEVERAWAATEAASGRPRFVIEGGGDAAIRSVRHLVAEALRTVLQNAVEAAGPKGVVRVTVEPSPAGVLVSVQDSGPGIPAERLAGLFDPFVAGGPPGAGRGIGLPVARAILGSLGGSIDVASAPGTGATFRLWVPRTPQQPAVPPPPEPGAPPRPETAP